MAAPTILLIGTADTKSDELLYLRERMQFAGATVLVMDVGVLEPGTFTPDISNNDVAVAAGSTIEAVKNAGDENKAMTLMALGACTLAAKLQCDGLINGMLALGGTMGTDLALDVAAALPLGFPKVVLSTVSYSHLIPPERITPDLMMVLWAGGLYGLNSLCKSALSQAAGAVVGACISAQPPKASRPMVGMTSLGKSCLSYMTTLKPALEARGYEVAVFHTTGMGGRAFEALAAEGQFVAVMDFSLQELANHLGGSCVTSGPDRLRGAGRVGVPQLVAPGAADMIDFPTWGAPPAGYEEAPAHAHNRLIASTTASADLRRQIAREIGTRLAEAKGPTCLLMPLKGVQAWDLPGEPLHDAPALAAFVDAIQTHVGPAQLQALPVHINDKAFCDAALAVFDEWVAKGLVPKGSPT
ncbi:MAG: Tm-1-like ATP-binding domain-containing protein [Betaproteobacteria bacterium]|nr:Tm-1-like ATP-binding domain-containing protein [Betaproteobacteria bacterium]